MGSVEWGSRLSEALASDPDAKPDKEVVYAGVFAFIAYYGTVFAAWVCPKLFGGHHEVPWHYVSKSCTQGSVRACVTTHIQGDAEMNTFTAGLHYIAVAVGIGALIYWLL